MAVQFDNEGNPIKQLIIVEAGSKLQMEQLILEYMAEGYELMGSLSMSAKGMYVQMMMAGKKMQRVGM